MKELVSKIPTASIVAVLITLCGFALLFYMVASGKPTDPGHAAQAYTGTFGLMGVAAAFYFSGTKRHAGPVNVENADNVNAGAGSSEGDAKTNQ